MSLSPTSATPAATPTPGKSRELPPGLARRELELPPGIAKKVDNGGALPTGIARRFAAPAPVTQLPPSAPATGTAPASTSVEPTADAALTPGGGETLDIRA